jgi:uncharacterized protein
LSRSQLLGPGYASSLHDRKDFHMDLQDTPKPDNGNQGITQKKSIRGFAAMNPQRQREIARLGGRAAHRSGHAHQFSSEEARAAVRKRHGTRIEGPSDNS